MSLYTYQATMVRAVDGDTVEVMLDLGLRIYHRERVRLVLPGGMPFNAPERWETGGAEAKQWIVANVPPGTPLRCRTFKPERDKYGRWLAAISYGPDFARDIASDLIEAGLAHHAERSGL